MISARAVPRRRPVRRLKYSDLGRETGAEGIHEYLQTKYTLTANPFT